MRVADLNYHLPPERIATHPATPRDAARLMVVRRDLENPQAPPRVEHRTVADLPDLGVLRAGDLMVVNQSRVVPAAFEGVRAATGGRVGGLYLQTVDSDDDEGNHWRVLLRSRGTLIHGEHIVIKGDNISLRLTLRERIGGGEWRVSTTPADAAAAMHALHHLGHTPLPPYILKARRDRGEATLQTEDIERYNTVYSTGEEAGSVAAPTAGLHFTPSLMGRLDEAGVVRKAVTLHVGPGTFAPLRGDTLDDHPMHAEPITISPDTLATLRDTRASGGRILAVGTTTVRSLESLPDSIPAATYSRGYCGSTSLFIRPDTGFIFRYTDVLLTNFHLPRSTLLALVASLPGMSLERVLDLYRAAVEEEYRFYSYGDAMLIC